MREKVQRMSEMEDDHVGRAKRPTLNNMARVLWRRTSTVVNAQKTGYMARKEWKISSHAGSSLLT